MEEVFLLSTAGHCPVLPAVLFWEGGGFGKTFRKSPGPGKALTPRVVGDKGKGI